jgi:hypothetical protein
MATIACTTAVLGAGRDTGTGPVEIYEFQLD